MVNRSYLLPQTGMVRLKGKRLKRGSPVDEYVDVSNNLRFYGNMRFAQLTLFLALTGSLCTLAFVGAHSLPAIGQAALKVLGAVSGLVFAFLDIRAAGYWHHYKSRATQLEVTLGFKQYTTLPRRGCLTATNAVLLLYALIVLSWIAFCVWPYLPTNRHASGLSRGIGPVGQVRSHSAWRRVNQWQVGPWNKRLRWSTAGLTLQWPLFPGSNVLGWKAMSSTVLSNANRKVCRNALIL